ncbi:MAG TPA: hypothetical protein PLY86_07505 [bacterium]|nr:hypothetical protein [bacterium]
MMAKHTLWTVILMLSVLTAWTMDSAMEAARAPEDVYQGELVCYPGPWAFMLHGSHIILVSDEELEKLSDPDAKLNLSLGRQERMDSLREICERAQAAGHRTLVVAFDHFFSQYRPGQGDRPRQLMPDMDEYIARIAAIGRFAEQHGMGLELSLLSPLEIGPAYAKATGETGMWMHYRKGVRDPVSGTYSVPLWRNLRWVNNKGPVSLKDGGVRVFAFREKSIHGTPYRIVNPDEIVEITDTAQVERYEGLTVKPGDFAAERIRIYGTGRSDVGPLNRVLVVQQYITPEMDYFSEKALPYLTGLLDRYADAGVKLNGLYSDEMHIQQDWNYFNHHDHGEFAMRYVSDGFAKAFSEQYGEQYRDFAKYLIYFVHGQEDFSHQLDAKADIMHVWGATPEDIQKTALFRSRYYRFLQNGVVDLFVRAKHHAEQRMGHRLYTRAHATWAESPTIDKWETGCENPFRSQYEYTSNFVWSNTVQQAASACHDYFAWGDYLTGTGNDHAECGWLDRNYVGLALACSTGILNEIPYSYGAHWGMPGEIAARRAALASVYGAAGSPLHGIVQDMQHRDTDVLMLYPLDLVSVDERFGSWMTQFSYANYVTQDKLLERAEAKDGSIFMANRTFRTLVATFEPFPDKQLLRFMRTLIESGGRVIWSGPPPLVDRDGDAVLQEWEDLFGVDYEPVLTIGTYAPGRVIQFEGALGGVDPQTILTHLLVDRIYPVTPRETAICAARVRERIVGTTRKLNSGGMACFLGYRPRDDQSQSLGYETRNWFEVLDTLGAYPPASELSGGNDNTDSVSRTTNYLTCRFPNGAVSIAPHLRTVEEDWEGGFARNEEKDQEYLKRVPPPSDEIVLDGFRVNGHVINYRGRSAVTFRINKNSELIGFAGSGADRIAIDGKETVFGDRPLGEIAWAPVPQDRRVENGAVLQIRVNGAGKITIPLEKEYRSPHLYAEGGKPGSRGKEIPCTISGNALMFEADGSFSNRWLYLTGE